MTIEKHFKHHSETPSDINEHLPKLREYAKKSKHITEMGVRTVVSTWAFLAGKPKKLVCYDLGRHPNVDEAELLAIDAKIEFEFHEKSVLEVEIEETDFLFIDTFHTATQLAKELELHAGKVRKYIGFHDTHTFWETGEPPYETTGGKGLDCGRGLRYALEPFLAAHPEWVVDYKTSANNGLTIIKRA